MTKRLSIKLAGETVFDNNGESDIGVYTDLWKSVSEREEMVEYGMCSENLRKLVSKDDSAATSGDAGKVSDALLFSVIDTKLKLPISKIMEDQGLFAPFGMMNNFEYAITFSEATDIMIAQSRSAVAGYSLENLELEYKTIEDIDVAERALSLYQSGKSLSYDHVTLSTRGVGQRQHYPE